MTEREAIDAAILAINTVQFPDSTDGDDFDFIIERGEEAIIVLADLREKV
jgi:hypothetical protein